MNMRFASLLCVQIGLAFFSTTTLAEEPSYKFTTGWYNTQGAGQSNSHGIDLNLRRSTQDSNAWVAWYQSPEQGLKQPRVGWDSSLPIQNIRIQPSIQAASGGFVGGSLSVETGESWFVGAGIGRTNLKPYTNLNFDPNDAWMASGGWRWSEHHALSMQIVRDNRQNPDQQHVHLIYRAPINQHERITLDVLEKSGLVQNLHTHRYGLSLGYEVSHYFVRVAYDPIINFTPQTMWRLSFGTRF
jgi:hypothetical protein